MTYRTETHTHVNLNIKRDYLPQDIPLGCHQFAFSLEASAVQLDLLLTCEHASHEPEPVLSLKLVHNARLFQLAFSPYVLSLALAALLNLSMPSELFGPKWRKVYCRDILSFTNMKKEIKEPPINKEKIKQR